jgi:hypothetical protein
MLSEDRDLLFSGGRDPPLCRTRPQVRSLAGAFSLADE